MKRKYGAARARETVAEQQMRERAAEMQDNRHSFGTKSAMGAPTRGKRRGRAFKQSYRK